jgi:small GTP-binding protein
MDDSKEEQDRKFGIDLKIILIGNVSTGKTSIMDRFVNNMFNEKCRATIGPSFSHKIIKKNGVIFRLQFWDIPGQDRTPSLTSIFCRDSQGIVFCCEVNDQKSLNDILIWKKSLESFKDINEVPVILLENKCDLLGNNEEKYNENIDETIKFAENNDIDKVFRTSAKTGYNIGTAISFLIDEIFKTLKEDDFHIENSIFSNSSQKLNKNVHDKSDKAQKCC